MIICMINKTLWKLIKNIYVFIGGDSVLHALERCGEVINYYNEA